MSGFAPAIVLAGWATYVAAGAADGLLFWVVLLAFAVAMQIRRTVTRYRRLK